MSVNILKYEGDVWKTADFLRGAGIKESDFPKFMMPYFALIMVESRLIRESAKLKADHSDLDIEDFIELFKEEGLGYNDFVIRQNKSLKDICKNDKTFDVDFYSYLKAFDPETRYLLGVDKGTEEEKFLDISGVTGQLKKKRILFETVQAWSEIDLVEFSNSEITTLEEHIKRKWADISAETAGEQYTPDDIISLISEIIASKIEDNGKFLTIYDPTCGGGNLLFGVEDKIQDLYPNRPTATYGQEWNGTLYALAKIESRFRKDTQIEYGNTLTDIGKFWDKTFSIIVANPPYGIKWEGFEKDIRNDTTERFVALPSISDGQFLFTQHILHKLADDGLSIVVHNGATLFSGDAGSGESTIRKHFFEQDYVEAIIQMPTDEFFNTGIYTYLWIFNKNKPANRKDKVLLINASELWEQLKKSKGKKRRQMNPTNRAVIVKALADFKDNSFAKVYDKWHFYYNKQSIMLTNIDDDGNFIQMPTKTNKDGEIVEEKSIKLGVDKITQATEDKTIQLDKTEYTAEDIIGSDYNSLDDYLENYIKPLIAELDYKEANLKVYTAKNCYWYDADKGTIIEETGKKQTALGGGKIVIKATSKKDSKTKLTKSIAITVELTKDLQKDYEIIPYHPNEATNQSNIDAFMAKYVTKPFEYIDNVIGVELNFNKVFFQAIKPIDIDTLKNEIVETENLINIERKYISNVFSINSTSTDYIDTNLGFKVPSNWVRYRLKDIGYLYSGLSGKAGDDFNQDDNPNNKGFIPFTNIANNTYLKKDHLGTVIIFDNEKQNKVKKGDIFFLMSSEGYDDIGKSSVLSIDLSDTYLNSFCKGFRVRQNICNPYFLNYLLHSVNYRQRLIIEGKGFTRINLKMEKVNDFIVYLPPTLLEQNKIVDILDRKHKNIERLISLLNSQLLSLKEFQKTLISSTTLGVLNELNK